MSEPVQLDATFFCTDHKVLLRSLIEQGIVPRAVPSKALQHGVKKASVPGDWVDKMELAGRTYKVMWDDGSSVYVIGKNIVDVSIRDYVLDIEALAGKLANVEHEAASFGPIQWWNNPEGPGYKAPASVIGNGPLGFGMAFRGAGHGRAMSRRWLERGPWRVLRSNNDTTLLQFHDQAADAAVSAEQATPCHRIVSDPDQAPLPLREAFQANVALKGTYVGPERRLVVSVAGRRVARSELRAAVATRFYQLLGPQQPVDEVVYSFLERAEFEQALPDLWLYGLEARLRAGDGPQDWKRMDDKYVPPRDDKPAWVKQLGRDDKVT